MKTSSYTPEFKERVRALYSRAVVPELDAVLEGKQHPWDLGKILKDGSEVYTITPEQILMVETAEDLLMLRAKARMVIDRNKLYEDWLTNAPGVNLDCQTVVKNIFSQGASLEVRPKFVDKIFDRIQKP